MKLFHGSDTVVRGPLANVGRAKVDFGQGFYLTKLRGQAESWAKTIASRGRNRKAFLNVYEFDTAAARRDLGQRLRYSMLMISPGWIMWWIAELVEICRTSMMLSKAAW
jgi:hypothetical protein